MAALVITAFALIIYSIYHYFNSLHSYWKNKSVTGPAPTPFFGNLGPLVRKKENLILLADRIYKEYPNEKVVGIYQGYVPTLVVRDPEIAKTVLIKDFYAFVNRGVKISNEPLLRHLVAVDGDEWRMLRQKLSPVFTTGKLKNMIPLLNTCAEKYMQYLTKIVEVDGCRDVRRLNMKYTMKTITTVAFGIEVDTFTEQKTTFELMAEKIFEFTGLRRIAILLNNIWPGIVDFLHIRVALAPETSKFFTKLVGEIIRDREGKPKLKHDFMDLLVELKEKGNLTRVNDTGVAELEVTDDLITAQALVFYAAGFETSSGIMSFCLYELAMSPKIQDKCYDEISKVIKKYDGKLDYESLKELHYLTRVLDEALRKYPIVSVLLRQSVTDYTFKDLNLTIKNGTKVFIPVLSYHRDEKYFPNPEKFDPDRFLPENKDSFNYDYYMPFGDGPRNCIGLRLGKFQALLGLAHLLNKFKVTRNERTADKIVFDPNQGTLSNSGGIWLTMAKRH